MANNLKTAETIARLRDVTINERELVDDVILITYDIPVTEEGKEARSKFLNTAPRIGAVMHSRSVYLMPNTNQAQAAAVDLSATVGGQVYIWTSKISGERAQMITALFDKDINTRIEHLNDRIQKEEQFVLNSKFGMADRMHKKSANLYRQLLFTVAQRGADNKTLDRLMTIENKLVGPNHNE